MCKNLIINYGKRVHSESSICLKLFPPTEPYTLLEKASPIATIYRPPQVNISYFDIGKSIYYVLKEGYMVSSSGGLTDASAEVLGRSCGCSGGSSWEALALNPKPLNAKP